MRARLEVINIVKKFGDFTAVDEISLRVEEGEFVTLLGPSGCGQTTLLNTIAGIEDATSGEITIKGKVVNQLGPFERDVAMVFQNYALYPHMTVEENIGFSMRLRKRHKDEIARRVREVASMLELEKLLHRLPRELSGGQQQRVAIGRAVIREPAIFLFDEPFSNLDAALRIKTRGEVKELHQRLGVTSIFVTHDQEEALSLSDHVAVLRPHAWLMLGHCAGLRNSQKLGDYVLAHGYVRQDHVLDEELPLWVPSHDAATRGFHTLDTTRAQASGLKTRPMAVTLNDILEAGIPSATGAFATARGTTHRNALGCAPPQANLGQAPAVLALRDTYHVNRKRNPGAAKATHAQGRFAVDVRPVLGPALPTSR